MERRRATGYKFKDGRIDGLYWDDNGEKKFTTSGEVQRAADGGWAAYFAEEDDGEETDLPFDLNADPGSVRRLLPRVP